MSRQDAFYARNIESWEKIIAFYEALAARPNLRMLLPLLRLVRQIAAQKYARSFRAGHSTFILMISTAEKHGLKSDEPFVSVFVTEDGRYRMEYHAVPPPGPALPDDLRDSVSGLTPEQLPPAGACRVLEEQVCTEEEALATLIPLLKRLWGDTHGKARAAGPSVTE